jgi:hypothetical protein
VSYASSFTGDDGQAYFRYRNLRLGRHSSWSWWRRRTCCWPPRAAHHCAGLLRFHREAVPALAAR